MTRPIKIADEANREQWLKTRYDLVNASECGTIMGDNKYCLPRDLFIRKLERREEEGIEERHIQRGKVWEPKLRDMWAQKTGIACKSRGWSMQNPDTPWLAATCDAFAIDKGERIAPEFKAPARWNPDDPNEKKETVRKKKLREWRWQCLAQLIVMQYARIDLVVGIPKIKWFKPADEVPMESLNYVAYMVAVGLPYYVFEDGIIKKCEPQVPPKGEIVFEEFEIIPYTLRSFTPKQVGMFMHKTLRFSNCLSKGYLDLDLW